MTAHITRFEEAEWSSPRVPDDLPEELKQRALLVRRKGLSDGHEGFHVSYVTMPAEQVVEPHSHDHGELIMVQQGSMCFTADGDTAELGARDVAVIGAGTVYRFDVGAEGVHFLLVRTARATSRLAG